MSDSIEALDRKRNRLLSWILAVYGIWHGMLLLYVLIAFTKLPPVGPFISRIWKYYLGAGLVAFLIFLFFIVKWRIYKRTLKKDPETAHAVDDERIKQNWLKAFRAGFVIMIVLGIFMEIIKIVSNAWLYQLSSFRDPWLSLVNIINFWHLQIVIYAGIVTCLGSFLLRNREA